MAALLTLSQLLAPVEGLSAGAVLLRTPSSSLHSCWARQGRGREGGQRRGKVGTGHMRMGGEIAAFAEGLRILSMREQRELLEKLQNANNDPAAPWKDTAPSWDALALRLEKKGKEQSTLLSTARVRLFDAPDGTVPRVTLYRDSSSWCPCWKRSACPSTSKRSTCVATEISQSGSKSSTPPATYPWLQSTTQ